MGSRIFFRKVYYSECGPVGVAELSHSASIGWTVIHHRRWRAVAASLGTGRFFPSRPIFLLSINSAPAASASGAFFLVNEAATPPPADRDQHAPRSIEPTS
jgi:hypothetical protein